MIGRTPSWTRSDPLFPYTTLFRSNPLDPFQRAVHMAVRCVRLAAEAVDDPDPNAGERREGCLAQLHDIGRIREGAEAKSQGRRIAVILDEWNDIDSGDDERAVDRLGLKHGLVEIALGQRPPRLDSIADPHAHRKSAV